MAKENSLINELHSGKGFWISDPIDHLEFTEIKTVVYNSIRDVFSLGIDYPDSKIPYLFQDFKNSVDLQRSVFERTISHSNAKKISSLKFINTVCSKLFSVPADVHSLGYPSFTWRYTRPNQPHDIRSAHRDAWFRLVNKEKKMIRDDLPSTLQTTKVWIAINVVESKSGLMVMPNSQHQIFDSEYTIHDVDNIVKPVISREFSERVSLELAPLLNSHFIVFGEDLVHAGAPNLSTQARISLEFAVAHEEYVAQRYTHTT